MNKETSARRDVLKRIAAAVAIGLPTAGTLWQRAAHAAGVPAYDPGARFDVAVSDVELRRDPAGRMLMARCYQPKGAGPFPTGLVLHGRALYIQDRFGAEPTER